MFKKIIISLYAIIYNHSLWGVENSARPVIFELKTLFGPKVLFVFFIKIKTFL